MSNLIFWTPRSDSKKKQNEFLRGFTVFLNFIKTFFSYYWSKLKNFGERASFQLQKLKKYMKYKNAIKKGRKTAQKFLDGKGVSTPLKLTDFFKKNVVQNDFSFKNTQYT